ncbi:MAG: DUF6174 domain-containing protein [Gammaproteobacteria bacterium]|nr:DUF6174 domain-containing protein [Gammaproteobacteria bacterium]
MLTIINDPMLKNSYLRCFIKSIITAALCCTLINLTACGADQDEETVITPTTEKTGAVVEETTNNNIAAEVQANKEKWLAHGVKRYQIEMQKLCFCAPDAVRLMIFDIADDEIITVRYADSGDAVNPSLYNQYSTVEGLFALVELALRRDPAVLAIAYNDEFGYIKELTIDYKENIADDEVTIIASNMKPSY